ncbi:LuxR C-terminal-related transcriptional regulator [Streptomyces sp. IBSNAI002]|uniref:LuxR C-terminal-related transcriptional regulator n=1 Tax=Streptomyces sp. IBSNAI002 TaxID=3457500 RepID=UPI003FD3F0E8
MASLGPGDYRLLWAVTERGITCDQSEFPAILADSDLADLFQADAVDTCEMDLRAGQCRQLAAYPAKQLGLCTHDPSAFRTFLTGHPAARYFQNGGPEPAVNAGRLTTRAEWRASPSYAFLREHSGMTEQLVIRLVGSPTLVRGMAVMRARTPFTALDLAMARQLGTLLGGVHHLRFGDPTRGSDGIRLTPREAEVLNLWQYGLTGHAIAHRLGITPRTVDKHAENLRAKFGTPDRTSTVLRAQTLGLLTADARNRRPR